MATYRRGCVYYYDFFFFIITACMFCILPFPPPPPFPTNSLTHRVLQLSSAAWIRSGILIRFAEHSMAMAS